MRGGLDFTEQHWACLSLPLATTPTHAGHLLLYGGRGLHCVLSAGDGGGARVHAFLLPLLNKGILPSCAPF